MPHYLSFSLMLFNQRHPAWSIKPINSILNAFHIQHYLLQSPIIDSKQRLTQEFIFTQANIDFQLSALLNASGWFSASTFSIYDTLWEFGKNWALQSGNRFVGKQSRKYSYCQFSSALTSSSLSVSRIDQPTTSIEFVQTVNKWPWGMM